MGSKEEVESAIAKILAQGKAKKWFIYVFHNKKMQPLFLKMLSLLPKYVK